jgi:hypothetical protein
MHAMTIFLESPWPAISIGLFLEAVLVFALLRTGRGAIFAAMAVVALLTGGGVLLDWLVVTDGEEVAATIERGRLAVEANDLERVFTFISPSAELARTQARGVRRLGEFSEIKVKGLTVQVNRQANPATATAHFTAHVHVRDPKGLYDGPGFADVHLEFRLEDGRWLVTQYKAEERL